MIDTRYNTDGCSNSFLSGVCLTVLVIQLPQRFQSVNGTSPLGAGVHVLPYTMFSPLGSIIAAQLMSKYKVPPAGLLALGGIFQTVGIVLLSTLSQTKNIQPAQYGYQILAGLGNGISVAITTLLIPPAVEKRDLGKFFPSFRYLREKFPIHRNLTFIPTNLYIKKPSEHPQSSNSDSSAE